MADEKEKAVKAKPSKQAKAPKKAEATERPTGKVAKLPDGYVPRLRKHYDEVVRAKLIEQFGYKNVMEVPKITKIVLNMGVGEATQDSKLVQVAAAELEKIVPHADATPAGDVRIRLVVDYRVRRVNDWSR